MERRGSGGVRHHKAIVAEIVVGRGRTSASEGEGRSTGEVDASNSDEAAGQAAFPVIVTNREKEHQYHKS